jgi:GDPmannose 4,6-dehydratase
MTTALITGVDGQDGSYLAEYLLELGYHVVGAIRRSSTQQHPNLSSVVGNGKFELVEIDMTDAISIESILYRYYPTEIYNLAAQSFVGSSWTQPEYTMNVNALGLMRLLEVLRREKRTWATKVYQASSSEMFGNAPAPQNEDSSMVPVSPYGISKLTAHRIAGMYRENYGLFVSCGILFNHESPRRGPVFVTQKIARGAWAARLYKTRLKLGNIEAKRDWGHAWEYVRVMHKMLQQSTPRDYVIATGHSVPVATFAHLCFKYLDLDYNDWVDIDSSADTRPTDIKELRGNCVRARIELGWNPQIGLEELVDNMMEFAGAGLGA